MNVERERGTDDVEIKREERENRVMRIDWGMDRERVHRGREREGEREREMMDVADGARHAPVPRPAGH